MSRRALAVAFAFVVPVVGAAAVNGCGSSEPQIEDLCGWLSGPNCYSAFYEDVGDQCGGLGAGNGPKGSFLTRDKLDLCVLAPPRGGQVIFDPPLDVKALPPASVSFTMLSADGNECGKGSMSGSSFSITIDPYPPDAGTGLGGFSGTGGAGGAGGAATTSGTTGSGGAGGAATTGSGGAGGAAGTGGAGGAGGASAGGAGGTSSSSTTSTSSSTTSSTTTSSSSGGGGDDRVIAGGTFSSTTQTGRAVFDTMCPNGESHHFDRYQLSQTSCSSASLEPRAELVTNAGGIDKQGHVIFRVYYPPANGGTQPDVVEYFDCAIPGAPEPCFDGVQDGIETDIDCGGQNPDASQNCALCPDDAKCAVDADCQSGICDYVMGFKKCQPKPM